MTEPAATGSPLATLASAPDADLEQHLASIDHEALLDEMLDLTARRLDGAVLGKAGVALEVVSHAAEATLVRYVSWNGTGHDISAGPTGSERIVRFEWQKLSDVVRYELGRLMLESLGLIGRFEMAGAREDLALLLRAEEVPHGVGAALRAVNRHRDLEGRALEKALRDIEVAPVLLDQQRATNEAVMLFGMLGELDGRIVEWRVGEGPGMVAAQSSYSAGGFSTVLDGGKPPSATLHFLEKLDFYQWNMGRADVPTLAVSGKLRFDGDFGVIENLGRLPEPFDPVQRWGSDRG